MFIFSSIYLFDVADEASSEEEVPPPPPTEGDEVPPPPPPPLEDLVEAIYSCKGECEGDLVFQQGDCILIQNRREDGWWIGQLFDKATSQPIGDQGLFPSNYVQPLSK